MKQFKTSLRTLYKFRLYSIVNILGLAVSLACVIIIARYVHQEVTVNSFIPEAEQIHLITMESQNSSPRLGGIQNPGDHMENMNLLKDQAIKMHSRFIPFADDHIFVNNNRFKTDVLVADSLFLKLIPYPVFQGTDKITTPNDAVITDRLAKQIFEGQNPIGQKIVHSSGKTLTIVGVLEKPTSKSVINFDVIVNTELHTHWMRSDYNIVKLQHGADYNQLNKRYDEFINLPYYESSVRFQLIPLQKFYFDTTIPLVDAESLFIKGNLNAVRILTIVALLIFLIGLFNFVNIYSVITLKREREFSIKKVHGAKPIHIFLQMLFENFIQALVGLILALAFVELIEKSLNNILSFDNPPNIQFNIFLWATIIFILPLITTIYPFVRYNFSKSLKSLYATNTAIVPIAPRMVFLFIQYFISFILITVALFFMKQLNFMLKTDPGYDADNIVITKLLHLDDPYGFDTENHDTKIQQILARIDFIREKMDSSPLIEEWTFSDPALTVRPYFKVKKSDEDEYKAVGLMYMSDKQINMLRHQLLEGRLWNSTDIQQHRFIINETAKQAFNITDIHNEYLQPERHLWMSPEIDTSTNPTYEIVGVIKDFNTGHLSQPAIPVVIACEEEFSEYIIARIIKGRESEAIKYLKNINEELYGNSEFELEFIKDEIAKLYSDDKKVSQIYTLFALLAIVISAMGLFALSLFDIQQRYREIALRKINGATAKDIMQLLLRKYLYLLAGAFVVAVPVSYFAISRYLEGFAHKAPISWWLFAVAAVVVSAISLLTLVWQIKRAMKINPANALQSE